MRLIQLFTISIICVLLAFTVSTSANAQEKPNRPSLKPPVLKSFWGGINGGSISLERGLALIDSSIVVISDKKEKMQISRFFLAYKSLDTYEDDNTGKVQLRHNTNGIQIRNEKDLPQNWRVSIYENLKKGDEIWITDLYVRDKKGNYFLAPDIRVIIN